MTKEEAKEMINGLKRYRLIPESEFVPYETLKEESMIFDTKTKNDIYERLKGLLEDKEAQEDKEIVDFYLRTIEDYIIETLANNLRGEQDV